MRNDLIVRQLLPELKQKKVLEVGCGICTFCNEAAPFVSEIYAIDIENKMQYIKKHPNLIFKMMDASKLEFRPMSFDTVVYYNTVGHLERVIGESIDESLRVLKLDGKLVFCSSMSYDRAVLDKLVTPYLQKLGLDVKISMYQTMKFVVASKKKRLTINYKEMKEQGLIKGAE